MKIRKIKITAENGITLVALVITIVILIILATITINAAFGEEGLIARAEQAKNLTEQATRNEQEALNSLMDEYDDIINGEEPEEVECTDIYVTLYEDGTLAFASTADNKLDKPIKAEYGNIRGEDYTIENFEDILLGQGDIKVPWFFDISEIIEGTGEYPNAIILDEIVPSSTSWWFIGMSEINGIENLNTSNVTKMQAMFYDCELQELNLSNFDTSNVTDMSHMFYGCEALQELNVSNFDTSNVTDMSGMFANDNWWEESILEKITGIENFDTSNVTNMSSMFNHCETLTELDVSNFDTSNVTDMSDMFNYCETLAELDLSRFDTSNVTNMSSMFGGCSALQKLDVSNFDTSNVTDMSSMFNHCETLAELDLSRFDTSNVTNMSSMFGGCSALQKLDVSNFDTSKVMDMSAMFYDCYSLTELDLSRFDTSNVTDMSLMFAMPVIERSHLEKIIGIEQFDTRNVTDMVAMFNNCVALRRTRLK